MGVMDATFANTMLDAGCALLNGGTAEFQTAGNVEVATIGLGSPAFASASGGEADANAMTEDSSATGGGPITKVRLKTSGGTVRVAGTVGESAAEIIIDDDSPPAGVTVYFTELTLALTVGTP